MPTRLGLFRSLTGSSGSSSSPNAKPTHASVTVADNNPKIHARSGLGRVSSLKPPRPPAAPKVTKRLLHSTGSAPSQLQSIKIHTDLVDYTRDTASSPSPATASPRVPVTNTATAPRPLAPNCDGYTHPIIATCTSTPPVTPPPPSPSPPPPTTTPTSPHFTLLAHYQPASWTIALLLQELGLTYTIVPMGVPGADGGGALVDTETSAFPTAGLGSGGAGGCGSMEFDVGGKIRVPVLVDHTNGDLVLMEMGAVVLYLVERYAGTGRPTGTLHRRSTSKEEGSVVQGWDKCDLCPVDEEGKQLARQWLFFSVTEHSPTFTHLSHFLYDHPHRLPSPIAHFGAHLHQVLSTLNSALASSPSGYLVPHIPGPTYADFVFWAWHWVFESGGLSTTTGGGGGSSSGDGQYFWERYPLVGQWQARMAKRDSVKRVVEEWERVKLEYV